MKYVFIGSALIGLIASLILLRIFIPVLKSVKLGQKILDIGPRWHKSKEGTPTMGGLIFIIPTILSVLFLYFRGSLNINHNLIITIFVFLNLIPQNNI